MSTFAQRPLQSPRGRDPHDFRQTIPDWEASVFDNATQFVVLYFRRPFRERRFEFDTFEAAVEHARSQADLGCVYAVTESGRFALIDRDKWNQWIERRRILVRAKLMRKL